MHLSIGKRELTRVLRAYVADKYGLNAAAFQFVNENKFITAQYVKVLLKKDAKQEVENIPEKED
ncbi:hypothetical protein ACIQXQ_20070 [Peribacillus sp. NPDC097198]|uniref:hypothetical protein n=1 Tax=Peribacillus sp. NPDC097198 TaxID=3364397 RepID=UPI003813288B